MDDIRNMLCTAGGIAFSNTYKVSFIGDARDKNTSFELWNKLGVALPGFVNSQLQADSAEGGPARWISLMCDEANLPGSQAATGEINGLYTGSGQFKYPHTRMYNDLTLSWIGDANMTALKFVNTWMDCIFSERSSSGAVYNTKQQTGPRDTQYRDRNRSVRLNYPDSYTMQISILKAEKDSNSETGRPSIRYVLEGAYPYSIDSIPLSFGSSQLVKVTANFYYERWYQYYTDQWGTPTTTYND